MPTSYYFAIPWVMTLARQLQPRCILDVGAGSGRYGFLFREQLMWGGEETGGQDAGVIDAIEIHPPYVTELHHRIYDHVHIGPAEQVIDTLGQYDLVFIGNMIEHLPKDRGQELLRKALAHTRGMLIVTTPALWRPQGPVFDNEAERHRSLWRPRDFAAFPNCRHCIINGLVLMAVLTPGGVPLPDSLAPWALRPTFRIKQWLKRRFQSGPAE